MTLEDSQADLQAELKVGSRAEAWSRAALEAKVKTGPWLWFCGSAAHGSDFAGWLLVRTTYYILQQRHELLSDFL